MLYNKKHETAVQHHNNRSDRIAVSKTVFEWFHVLFVAVIISVFIFCYIFRISVISTEKSDNSNLDVYVLTLSYGYAPKIGDSVVVRTKTENYTAAVIACEGQYISMNVKNSEITVDFVLLDNFNISAFDMEETYGFGKKIPNGCVMIIRSDFSGEKSVFADIVKIDDIVGKINSVIYPFEYLGRNVDDIKR